MATITGRHRIEIIPSLFTTNKKNEQEKQIHVLKLVLSIIVSITVPTTTVHNQL